MQQLQFQAEVQKIHNFNATADYSQAEICNKIWASIQQLLSWKCIFLSITKDWREEKNGLVSNANAKQQWSHCLLCLHGM